MSDNTVLTRLNVLQRFDAEGLILLPLPRGKKVRPPEGWRARLAADNDLTELSIGNVAVPLGEPSGGIVDVDLDHPFAVRLGQRLLPKTGWIFGRRGKPRSHWIYRVDNCGKRKAFTSQLLKNVAGKEKMLCEYRSTGTYTVFPPSTWTPGLRMGDLTGEEPIEFSSFKEVAAVSKDNLPAPCDHYLHTRETNGASRRLSGRGVGLDDVAPPGVILVNFPTSILSYRNLDI